MPQTDQSRLQGNSTAHSLGANPSHDESQAQSLRQIRGAPAFATVWKYGCGDRANNSEPEAGTGDSSSSLTMLSTDEDDADWHIACLADAQIAEGEAEHSKQVLLWTQFSQVIPGKQGRARYLRCTQTQLPDFRAWLSWQQHHPTIIPKEVHVPYLQHSASQTRDATQQCQQQLISALQPCSRDQRRIVFMVIYCVANSIRGFQLPELTAAATIGLLLSRSSSSSQEYSALSASVHNQIANLCQSLLQNSAGMIEFADPSMKTFVSQLRLPNITPGHSTMTRICFQQIRRLGAAFIIQPWYSFRSWFDSVVEWPLLQYVAENWFVHYRLVPESGNLDFELYHLLKDALLQDRPQEPSMLVERRIVDAGYSVSKIYHLSSLEAIFRNMGARTKPSAASVLGQVPTLAQWRQMQRAHSIVPLDFELTMHEDEAHDAIVVQLESRLRTLCLDTGGRDTAPIDDSQINEALLPARDGLDGVDKENDETDTGVKAHLRSPYSSARSRRSGHGHSVLSETEWEEFPDAEMDESSSDT